MNAPLDASLSRIADRVRAAAADRTPLCLRGGGSKDFFGPPTQGVPLDTIELQGILAYEPTELVVTAAAGTPLVELEAALAEKGQCLPFEPPHFGWQSNTRATVGGMVAAGWSGPARASVGGVRDYVLGLHLINGRGEHLQYGGQVMKNVAGYDVSRLLVGSMGTLGLITQVSLKVLPLAPAEATLVFALSQAQALQHLHGWGGQPLPLNASCWVHDPTAPGGGQDLLFVRLRGAVAAVESACKRMLAQCPGQRVDPAQAQADWTHCRNQTLPFFTRPSGDLVLWRLSVAPTAPALNLPWAQLVEWHGGLRWLWAAPDAAGELQAQARAHGGFAMPFVAQSSMFTGANSAFDSQDPVALAVQRRIKQALDPQGVFNPGRLSAQFKPTPHSTMQTSLAPEYRDSADGRAAEAIVRKCVHCGFCTATCPTYQLLGDELDGPRGRIYLIKQVLEGQQPTRKTQQHLDRCLTCRNCESTCPSGVDYGHLIDIGRKLVDAKVSRPLTERAVRWALKEGIPSPLFGPAMALGQAVRPLMPAALQAKVPPRQAAGVWPAQTHTRKVLLLAGCAQPAMSPNINPASARVLDAAGIQTLVAPKAGCCGAVKFHLNDQDGAKQEIRANIDAWWPHIEAGVEAIVINASGCGTMVKDYGHVLQDDPAYATKAIRVSALARDLGELLAGLVPALQQRYPDLPAHNRQSGARIAFHPPCTLQHGQKLKGLVEPHLAALGYDIRVAGCESHLCCGSAGTYSVLNPTLAYQLRDRKLGHLGDLQPTVIASANIGCITHLQSGTDTPVRHWVEVLDASLQALAVRA